MIIDVEENPQQVYREFTSLIDEQSLRIGQLEAFMHEIIEEAKDRRNSPAERLTTIVTMASTALRMRR
jgi:hypothetical protein